MVVNGTQYVGHARPGGNTSFETEKNCSEQLIVREETTKERDRRLLIQHRKSLVNFKKPKKSRRAGKHLKCERKLQRIKEEDVTFDAKQCAAEDDSGVVKSESQQERTDAIGNGRRRAELVLRKKFKGWSGRRMIKVKGPSVRGVISVVWALVVREFSYAIRLYSCSAVRYARFRSNRRFKPGD